MEEESLRQRKATSILESINAPTIIGQWFDTREKEKDEAPLISFDDEVPLQRETPMQREVREEEEEETIKMASPESFQEEDGDDIFTDHCEHLLRGMLKVVAVFGILCVILMLSEAYSGWGKNTKATFTISENFTFDGWDDYVGRATACNFSVPHTDTSLRAFRQTLESLNRELVCTTFHDFASTPPCACLIASHDLFFVNPVLSAESDEQVTITDYPEVFSGQKQKRRVSKTFTLTNITGGGGFDFSFADDRSLANMAHRCVEFLL